MRVYRVFGAFRAFRIFRVFRVWVLELRVFRGLGPVWGRASGLGIGLVGF